MSDFLLEVGTEELPASFVTDALQQWRVLIPQSLTQNNLAIKSLEVYGTPRRLAVLITGLPAKQPDRVEDVKGPPSQAAFKDGQPTKAAVGFAKKQGVEVEKLEIRPTDKGDFVFVRQTIPGRVTSEILGEIATSWILQLEGKRFMRWGDGDLKFPRRIERLVALLDDTVLPIELINGSETIKSDRITSGHRVLHPQPVTLNDASDYATSLRSAFVDVDEKERLAKIQEQIESAARNLGGHLANYPELLAEVTNLVEWSSAVVGKFDEEFLLLPPEVITTVMVTHQRYFPVFKAVSGNLSGVSANKTQSVDTLLPYFITVSNGDPLKSDIIAAGNERVIRARLADAQFFYNADLAKPLESYLPKLEKVTFQEDLGSVRAKVERIVRISELITKQIGENLRWSNHELLEFIGDTASLCKADLVTQMVYEFPELQGIMGHKYALSSGKSPAVAIAIEEHYLPKGAGDVMPQSLPGQVVGIADRLDTLVSIFGLGMLPTGSSDPFALRRAANAIVNIIWMADLPINIDALLEQVASKETKIQLQEFFIQRIRNQLQDERGIDYDLVNAACSEKDTEYNLRALTDLLDVRDRALFLQTIRNNRTLEKIYETVNRSTRLAIQGNLDTNELNPEGVVNRELFQKSSESAFYEGLVQLVPQTQTAKRDRNYQQLVAAISEIAPIVSKFFDGDDSVLVMDNDPNIKQNRLNLLGLLRNHSRVLGDFGAIVKG
ncbi:glycine--tRNA ligase subunit beta [Chlorogloea sp. CCALA 695]|uniref:glycine--tRNA ligase subunit beta n=1 Tax=Chlorogloea sp. CCALA 695 TaxID=2107693 RepID=UPI000D06B241|nr:glycine--tRNA ligase subunit beta [Chlorogloea sp. CCALA 695]PSB33375.1 glycine--tRNA ligase subunit beta [Chlorogloea sp. CCALA 695]